MKKKNIYIYPTNRDSFIEGNNPYIRFLIENLSADFTIVSRVTKFGLLDMLFKIRRSDVLYFNWIEDIPNRRFGLAQVPVLFTIIALAKVLRKKIVWFVHNNISHDRKHLLLKRMIIGVLKRNADIVLSHSSDFRLSLKDRQIISFDHPLDPYRPVATAEPAAFDLLIWGTVAPYKGILEFVDFLAVSPLLQDFRILIAGKFSSDDYYNAVCQKKPQNVTIINKKLSEAELISLFQQARYVLFTYNSPSVLSSAALCKSLSFGKEVIGPNVGSFRELGRKGLVHNYESFASLETLLVQLKSGQKKAIDAAALAAYAQQTGWPEFARFLAKKLNGAEAAFA